jgi:ABC-2 type transport system ATP-binding protein
MEQSIVRLALNGVSKHFGAQAAVDGVALEIHAGEVVALLGPNGAGKSTTLALSLGFLRPDTGSVFVDGFDMAVSPAQGRRTIGYIPEQVNLYPLLSGAENLEYFAALAGDRLSAPTIHDALLAAGLPADAHHRRMAGYSKGMRQKVGIAIALARHCRLLLLDEPTSGLDPLASSEFNGLIQDAASRGAGVLMATHDIFRAWEIASRVLVMRRGRIAAAWTARELAHQDLESAYLNLMREEAPAR